MADDLKRGDKVKWASHGGEAVGKVVKKVVTPTTIKGHKVAASKNNPEYVVESEKSGGKAAHRRAAFKKA